ncbi:MAG: phenylalanine--tRNA ligase subunit beta [Caldisericia bacterium]|jgi:phenylalanyl-tRNA synthetase beta chain|nr:phenylalanine--tRNA ligase subunit beta [Caldisericia bacterium]
MKVSLNWLCEFIDLNEELEKIKEITTFRGLEIEEIFKKESSLKECYTGKVKDIKKINDKLSQCFIEYKGQILKSVTGAKNLKVNDIVPFALPGGVVYKHSIKNGEKKRELINVTPIEFDGYLSEVLLLSYDEIGLEEPSLSDIYKEGIFVLPEDTPLDKNLIEVLGLNDYIFEIKTLNRGDVLSLYGLAKEFERYGLGKFKINKELNSNYENLPLYNFEIEIENENLCPRYVGIIVEGVEVKKSNISNLKKLLSIEQRPVNNIVDSTNVFMFEYGQPLHAFDLDKINQKIIVRESKKGEKILTLDGKERELEEGMLLICDAINPIAIAGIIGGKETEVGLETKNVLLESAYFNPISISTTKRKLKIDSEAASRFEKGVDVNRTLLIGFNSALTFNGKKIYKPIDVYPKPIVSEKIKLRYDKARKIIGFNIKDEDIIKILGNSGFKEIEKGNDYSIFIKEYNRPDVKTEIDLIEEIVRYYGIEKIQPTIPSIKIDPYIENFNMNLKEKITQILTSLGLNEIVTLSIIEKEYLLSFGFDRKPIEILNPLRQDQNVLRTYLLPSLLKVIEKNINVGNKNIGIFEIGKIYYDKEGEFIEEDELIVGISGKFIEKYWGEKDKVYNFYNLKGILEKLFQELNINEFIVLNYDKTNVFHPTRYGKITINSEIVGELGEIDEDICKKININQKVYVLRIELDKLKKFVTLKKDFKEISKFPNLTFDLSVVLPKEQKFHKLLKIAKEEGGSLLSKISLFDIYEDEKIGLDKKSYAINLLFSSIEKTLTDKDIQAIINRIEYRIEKELNGFIRKKVE